PMKAGSKEAPARSEASWNPDPSWPFAARHPTLLTTRRLLRRRAGVRVSLAEVGDGLADELVVVPGVRLRRLLDELAVEHPVHRALRALDVDAPVRVHPRPRVRAVHRREVGLRDLGPLGHRLDDRVLVRRIEVV